MFSELNAAANVPLVLDQASDCGSKTRLCQEGWPMSSFKDQLRQVLRRLRRAPMFTVITLITLAAGVGANTVVFSVLEGVLLKSLPYSHPEELITVAQAAPGINNPALQAAPSLFFFFFHHVVSLSLI